jgi:predicted dehydrogenase
MSPTDRRQFIKASAVAAGAAMVTPARAASRSSANDHIRIGLLGLGGRMGALAAAVEEMAEQNVEIAAICDCDRAKRDAWERRFEGRRLSTYDDMRRLFDDPSIDGVIISLGDRWHALSTIRACQAGKDVLVEKPCSHNLFEGRQMVAAARKYNRIVQHGTQNRSSPNIMEGIAKLREGVIGDLYMARGIDFKIRGNLGTITPSPVPDGLDWDAWLGPKAMRPYSQFSHRRWYWLLDLASGEFANQLSHEVDIIRWGLGLDQHPTCVTVMGGKYVHDDDRTSPNHVAMSYRFGDSKPLVTCEHRSWYTNSEAGFRDQYPFVAPNQSVGTIFFGSEGYLIFPDYSSYHTFLGPQGEPGPSKAEEGHPMMDRPLIENWIAAMRARDHRLLSADIEEAHKTMVMCLLPRAAYETGQPLIHFDPATEAVIDNDRANRLLNEPEYRSPYVVPKEV